MKQASLVTLSYRYLHCLQIEELNNILETV